MCEFCEENKSINNEFGNMHIDDDFDDSIDEIYYECTECGESDKENGDVKLEDIAEWVD